MENERKNRTHVITVRCPKDKYIVVLNDKDGNEFEILWDNWIKMSEKERHTA